MCEFVVAGIEGPKIVAKDPEIDVSGRVEIIRLIKGETLLTVIKVDLLNGFIMEGEAIVDTGSVLSFLSTGIILQKAPSLIRQMKPWPGELIGITGRKLPVMGLLTLHV